MARRAASLQRAITWIADNDETAETSVEEMAMLISVQLVADLWSREPEEIARRVLNRRRALRDDAQRILEASQ